MFQNKPWVEDFESLPPDDQAKVVDFIHALKTRRTVSASRTETPSLFELVKDLAGSVEDGPEDLSTNPEHLD
ncbi:MAG: hypothetical protein CVV27_20330, partial [Candidatus Melainabacteria bacterium HGW-Melainabacteria-1]